MIRRYEERHCSDVLDIWLSASLRAHHFIDADFWISQVEDMRSIYLPASETWVFQENAAVTGFYSLYKNSLAALFVAPEYQGRGVGKELIGHAKTQRESLTLTVYRENESACRFYLSQGFTLTREQIDVHTGHEELLMSFTER